MRDIFVISDTHFFHENTIKYFKRPFDSVEEMNEVIRDNWNKVVKPGDKVYHLGDVFMGDKEEFKKFWPTLNGKKRLVVGNHDDIKFLSSGRFFQKVDMWRIFSDYGLILSHVPMHESTLYEGRFGIEPPLNIHGHIHTNKSPSLLHRCVCVEQINYTPISIEEIRGRN